MNNSLFIVISERRKIQIWNKIFALHKGHLNYQNIKSPDPCKDIIKVGFANNVYLGVQIRLWIEIFAFTYKAIKLYKWALQTMSIEGVG